MVTNIEMEIKFLAKNSTSLQRLQMDDSELFEISKWISKV